MRRRLGIIVGVALLATACARGGAEPGVERVADPSPLVEVAARWQCDRQRFAFDSLADLDTLLAETLAAAGVSAADYADFEARLADDGDLRVEVRAVFERECLGG